MAVEMQRALASLNMPPSKYVLTFMLPLVGAGFAVILILRIALPFIFEGPLGPVFWTIPIFFIVIAFIYPYLIAEKRKSQIDNTIHFFITHMGVLATSNIPRVQIMRLLGEKKEYGALAEETRKITMLVESWNMSLAEAARFVAKRTPSEIFADFLDRFAYSLESGEELETFLKTEQVVVINDYAAIYKGALYEVENMKDMFNSVIMSGVFLMIFAIMMPIITGLPATMLLGGAIFIVMFLEVIFVYFTKAKAPTDPMWHNLQWTTPLDRKLMWAIPLSLGLAIGVTIALLKFTSLPFPIIIAAGLTPLLITGFPVGTEEENLKRRDDNFAAFIRSLGASAAARGGQVTETLRHLQNHDFGPLTQNIRDLYRRLNLRVDDTKAWRYFAAECGSNLIEKFSRMFMEGVKAGGKPDQIGRIISDNFVAIVTLRKSRYQTASSFKGLLYGLAGGMAFSLFVGVGIVEMLATIFENMNLAEGSTFSDFFNFAVDLQLITFLVVFLMLAHSIASALMMKMADGGNYFRSWVDLVGIFWVSAIVSVLAQKVLVGLLGVGS